MRPGAIRDFLCRVIEAVVREGCTTVNLPDTVGYGTPDETRSFFEDIRARVPNSDRIIFSAHCHDDLGLAVANSLAAIQGGVRQVECTINGIGERAGNASVEEIVMALRVRPDRLPYTTAIDATALYETSQLLTRLTSEPVQANKAIVGRNAFAHEAGIHQDGVLKDRAPTKSCGRRTSASQRRGSCSAGTPGRHAVLQRCDALELGVTAGEIEQVYHAVISLGEHRKAIGDGDLRRIVERVRHRSGRSGQGIAAKRTITDETGTLAGTVFCSRTPPVAI